MKNFRTGQFVKTTANGIALYGIDIGEPMDGVWAEHQLDENTLGIVLAARQSRIVLPKFGSREHILPDALLLIEERIGWVYGRWLTKA